MTLVKRLVLDVLKPHQPNALEFAGAIAALGDDYRVELKVIEVDEHTETLQVRVEAAEIDFDGVKQVTDANGASLHSIDEVLVVGA